MDKKKISCFLNVLSVHFIIHVMFYCSFAGVIAMQCLGNGDSNVESLAAIRGTSVCFTSVAHPIVYRELFPSHLREENIRFQTDWIFCSGHIDNNCPSLNLNCIWRAQYGCSPSCCQRELEDSDITAKRSQHFSQKREWYVLRGTGERRNLGLGVTFRGTHLRLSLGRTLPRVLR